MTARNDLGLYDRHADAWWGADRRTFRSLRQVKAFHLELLVREWGAFLDGARIVDLGCGGGLLGVPLAERGAAVTGVDRSHASLAAGRAEAERRGLSCAFLRADLYRAPLPAESCDVALLSDVIEHVENPRAAVAEAARLLRPGGRLFVNTFAPGATAAFAVVHLAEGLGLVPRGTHDPALFVAPDDLHRYARDAGLGLERLVWERPALLRTLRTFTIHLREAASGVGYSAFYRKGSA